MYCYNGANSLNTNISKSACVEVVSVLMLQTPLKNSVSNSFFCSWVCGMSRGRDFLNMAYADPPKGVVQMFSLSVTGNQRKLTLRKTS